MLTVFSACDRELDASNFLALSGFDFGSGSQLNYYTDPDYDPNIVFTDIWENQDDKTRSDNIIDCLKFCKSLSGNCKAVRYYERPTWEQSGSRCYVYREYIPSGIYLFSMDWSDGPEYYAGIVCDYFMTLSPLKQISV